MIKVSDGSPISDPDTLDAAGVLLAGGMDLVISCSGPLDESDQTSERLKAKVRAYVAASLAEGFFRHFGAKPGPLSIEISCRHAVSPKILTVIESLKREVAVEGIELRLVMPM